MHVKNSAQYLASGVVIGQLTNIIKISQYAHVALWLQSYLRQYPKSSLPLKATLSSHSFLALSPVFPITWSEMIHSVFSLRWHLAVGSGWAWGLVYYLKAIIPTWTQLPEWVCTLPGPAPPGCNPCNSLLLLDAKMTLDNFSTLLFCILFHCLIGCHIDLIKMTALSFEEKIIHGFIMLFLKHKAILSLNPECSL